MRPLNIILTGGTIDKVYNQYTGMLSHTTSCIEDILTHMNCMVPYRTTELFLKDSLEITNGERSQIVAVANSSSEDSIIVVHGTDTMILTARWLATVTNKTIITVGAFKPHAVIDSDAEANIGAAIAYSQSLPFGSYVAMNGIAFPHDNVKKDYEIQCFANKNN